MEEKRKFFNELMSILDKAEGTRDTTFGPFSFLQENFYVRKAVVSSLGTSTSIAGLKMYLAMHVLEMHTKENECNISINQLQAIVNGDAQKKYSLNYNILDDCINIEKNKKAMLENMRVPVEDAEIIKHIEETDILIPYIFMEKLREEVWNRLRDFFMLCEQEVCSECSEKSKVYLKFIQAVALYEIFYIEFVQERAADYTEQLVLDVNEFKEHIGKLHEPVELLKNYDSSQIVEKIPAIQSISETFYSILEVHPLENLYNAGIFRLLVIEFGISLNAMCYLLMIFEAMHVCDYKMRGLKHLSLQIKKKLEYIYEKDLAILEAYSRKRCKRAREVNKEVEKLLKNQYPKSQNIDTSDAIYGFMLEICKPVRQQDRSLLRGFEVLLGYPIYKEESTMENGFSGLED